MKQQFLIIAIILSSLVSGFFGAFAFQTLNLDTSSKNTSKAQTHITTENISIENLESEITKTVETVSESIVSIVISKDLVVYRQDPWGFFRGQAAGTVNQKVGGGSGFFIAQDGTILTNKHVVSDESADYTVILSDGREYPARVLALDPVNDLAVIKIDDADQVFTPLEIKNRADPLQIGEFAIAVGNALAEFQNSVSFGIVSGLDRSIDSDNINLTGLIQTDAAINPGNSGGPLMSLDGHVIGINTAIASGSTGIGFAFELSQERIESILQSIASEGKIFRPFIGINYTHINTQLQQELGLDIDYGAYIIPGENSIFPGSSAEIAGLQEGDIILEVNNEQIKSGTLSKIIQNSLPGDTLKLKVLKANGSLETLTLPLGSY